MTKELLNAIKALQIKDGDDKDQDFCIDDMLTEGRPRKRAKTTPDALKRELEENFLNPPTSFSPEWLNKLQQYVGQH